MMTHRYNLSLLPLIALCAFACAPTDDKSDDTDETDGETDTDTTDTDDTDETDDTVVTVDPCTITGVTCDGTLAVLSGTISDDLRLTDAYTWVLSGEVEIGEEGTVDTEPTVTAELTIDAGVTVYGTEGSFLAINRGSKIFANGTAADPVVFTSEATSLGDPRSPGGWGGLVLNGKAPINNCASPGCAAAGEAGTGFFGGSSPADSSGKLTYVRVEWGGFDVLPDEELNGVTFAGVGSGTEVDFLQVHGNDDDGVEFFGGTVDAKHIVASCVKDDGIDTDLGYVGRIQHAVVVACADFSETSDPTGSENDNLSSDNTATPVSAPVLSNITLIGRPLQSSTNNGIVIRRGSALELHNAIVTGFGTSCLSVRDAATAPIIKNSIFDCATTFEGPDTAFEDAVFNAASAGNSTADADLTQTSLTLGSDPDFRPNSGSPAASGAVQPSATWFDAVTHKGAFAEGGTDWTDGWTDFSAD